METERFANASGMGGDGIRQPGDVRPCLVTEMAAGVHRMGRKHPVIKHAQDMNMYITERVYSCLF